MVVVTLSDPTKRRTAVRIRASTAADFLPEALKVFGAGTIKDPEGCIITTGAGDLVEGGVYIWTATPGEQHLLRGVGGR